MGNLKVMDAVKEARKKSKKRNFSQSFDLIINLRDFNPKEEKKIETFFQLPNGDGRETKICALVGAEMKKQVSKCDKAILNNQFKKYKNARKSKKLARNYDYFIAQATLMPQIAQTFGKYFGPVGKMPNPKAGQVITQKSKISNVVKKLKNTSKITVSKSPIASLRVGEEKMDDKKLAENINFVIDHMEHTLPKGRNNIKNIMVKTTMGGPVKIK